MERIGLGIEQKEAVLFPVPHRQYVFTIPNILRKFLFLTVHCRETEPMCGKKSDKVFIRVHSQTLTHAWLLSATC